MNKLELNKSRNKGREKISYLSLGNRLVEDKKNFFKLKLKKDKTFNEAIENLNGTLKKTESLLHINHYQKKNDIDSLFPRKQLNYLKKMQYHNKWHIKYTLPIMENNNILKKLKEKNANKSRNSINFPANLFRSKHFYSSRNSKSVEEIETMPYYLKRFEQKKSNIIASEIVKKSILALSKRDRFSKYRYKIEMKVGDFLDYNDKFSNYYDFDKKIKKNIKDEKTGITIPGNSINRNSLGYINTLQPKNIKLKIKSNITVPEKTLLPVPHGIIGKGLNYTHITLKNAYNENNKLI